MNSPYGVTLGCGASFSIEDLEASSISYVPCGQVNGKDQPLLKYASHWDTRRQVTQKTYGKNWHHHILKDMTGVQLMTGFPTYRPAGKHSYLYYTSLDIEALLIEQHPKSVDNIREIYDQNIIGNPCVLKTKSNGLRLDVYTPYVGTKMSFKNDRGMLFEILAQKCLSRLDERYQMIDGSILDMPTLSQAALREIYYVITDVATEEQSGEKPREVVGESQIGDLDIQWDSEGRSQLFSTEHCRITSHKSNRDEVRFSKSQGGVDGKCFNCGGTWWEVPPINRVKKILGLNPSVRQNNPNPSNRITPKTREHRKVSRLL